MAKGTRMKNLETQVQQCGSSMNDLQAQVDQLELGSKQNYKAIMVVDRKLEVVAYPGLLQPLTIPRQAWESVSMDFIKEVYQNLKGRTAYLWWWTSSQNLLTS